MRTLGHRLLIVAALLSGAAACGGASDPAPGPLGRHFEDKFLDPVPVDKRDAEIQAKQAYDRADMVARKAEADYNESRVQLDVAKNERDAAKLDLKSAESRQKAAEQSADMNRVKEAEAEVKAARAAAEAADNRYKYIDAYRKWLKRMLRYTQHELFWKEAQYELAQAKIAQANNIAPKGFKLDDYVKQEAERGRRVSDAKNQVEREKGAALSARDKWIAHQKEADKLLGKQSQFPDPMNPNAVTGTDDTAGAGGFTVGGDSGTKGDSDPDQPVQDPTMNDDDGDGDGDDEEN